MRHLPPPPPQSQVIFMNMNGPEIWLLFRSPIVTLSFFIHVLQPIKWGLRLCPIGLFPAPTHPSKFWQKSWILGYHTSLFSEPKNHPASDYFTLLYIESMDPSKVNILPCTCCLSLTLWTMAWPTVHCKTLT